MAVGLGIVLPAIETARRIRQILDYKEFFSWFDDYLLGMLLLFAAYAVFKKKKNSVAYLIATWGAATCAIFISLLGQFKYYQQGTDDPGIFPTSLVAVAKALMFLYTLIGLFKAVKGSEESR